MRNWFALASLVAVVSAARGDAQGSRRVDPSAAELAIALGELDVAEAALYEQARRSSREPAYRGTLGAFLAARGKFLVGATLLEEARFFGGDTAAIEARLFEVHRWTGQYDRAALLPTVRVARDLRDAFRRAAGTAAGGAAEAIVPMMPNELLGLGRITITVGDEVLEADIHPIANGLQLPSTMALFSAVQPVGANGDTTFAVARTLGIGGVVLGPVPATLVPSLRTARVGLDVLGQLYPTFDPVARTLTVRSTAYTPAGRRLPLLLTFPGVTFVANAGSAAVALHEAAGRAALRGYRWTLDVAGGAVVIER